MRFCDQSVRIGGRATVLAFMLSLFASSHAAQPRRREFPNAPRPSKHVRNALNLARNVTVTGLKFAVPSSLAVLGFTEVTTTLVDVGPEVRNTARLIAGLWSLGQFAFWGGVEAYSTGCQLFGRRRVSKIGDSLKLGLFASVLTAVPEAVGLTNVGLAQQFGLDASLDIPLTVLATTYATLTAIEGAKVVRNIFQDEHDPLFHRIWESLRLPESYSEQWRNMVLALTSGAGLSLALAHAGGIPLDLMNILQLSVLGGSAMASIEGMRQGINTLRMSSEAGNEAYERAVWHLIKRPFVLSLTGVPAGLLAPTLDRWFNEAASISWPQGLLLGMGIGAALSVVGSAGQAVKPALRAMVFPAKSIRDTWAAQVDALLSRWQAHWQTRQEEKELKSRLRRLERSGEFGDLNLGGDWPSDKAKLANAVKAALLLQVHPSGGEYVDDLNLLLSTFDELQERHDPLDPK